MSRDHRQENDGDDPQNVHMMLCLQMIDEIEKRADAGKGNFNSDAIAAAIVEITDRIVKKD